MHPPISVPPRTSTFVTPNRPVTVTEIPPIPSVQTPIGRVAVGVPRVVTKLPGRNAGGLGYYQMGNILYLCGSKAKKNLGLMSTIVGMYQYGKICWAFPLASMAQVTSIYYSILGTGTTAVVSPFQARIPAPIGSTIHTPIVSPGLASTVNPTTVAVLPAISAGGIGYYRMGSNLYLCGSKTYRHRGAIKTIPLGSWDRIRKCWKFPLASAGQVATMYQSILSQVGARTAQATIAVPANLPKKIPGGIHTYQFRSDPANVYLCGTKVMQNKKMAKSVPGMLLVGNPPRCFAYPISQSNAVIALRDSIIAKVAAAARAKQFMPPPAQQFLLPGQGSTPQPDSFLQPPQPRAPGQIDPAIAADIIRSGWGFKQENPGEIPIPPKSAYLPPPDDMSITVIGPYSYICGPMVMRNKEIAESVPGAQLIGNPPRCYAYPINQVSAERVIKLSNRIREADARKNAQQFGLSGQSAQPPWLRGAIAADIQGFPPAPAQVPIPGTQVPRHGGLPVPIPGTRVPLSSIPSPGRMPQVYAPPVQPPPTVVPLPTQPPQTQVPQNFAPLPTQPPQTQVPPTTSPQNFSFAQPWYSPPRASRGPPSTNQNTTIPNVPQSYGYQG